MNSDIDLFNVRFEPFKKDRIASEAFLRDALQSLRAAQRVGRDWDSMPPIRRLIGKFTGANDLIRDHRENFKLKSQEAILNAVLELNEEFFTYKDSLDQVTRVVGEHSSDLIKIRQDLNEALTKVVDRFVEVEKRIAKGESDIGWLRDQVNDLQDKVEIQQWYASRAIFDRKHKTLSTIEYLILLIDLFLKAKSRGHNRHDIDLLEQWVIEAIDKKLIEPAIAFPKEKTNLLHPNQAFSSYGLSPVIIHQPGCDLDALLLWHLSSNDGDFDPNVFSGLTNSAGVEWDRVSSIPTWNFTLSLLQTMRACLTVDGSDWEATMEYRRYKNAMEDLVWEIRKLLDDEADHRYFHSDRVTGKAAPKGITWEMKIVSVNPTHLLTGLRLTQGTEGPQWEHFIRLEGKYLHEGRRLAWDRLTAEIDLNRINALDDAREYVYAEHFKPTGWLEQRTELSKRFNKTIERLKEAPLPI